MILFWHFYTLLRAVQVQQYFDNRKQCCHSQTVAILFSTTWDNFFRHLGLSTLGERFNPAKDCADIVDNLPEAEDGFYWIKLAKGKPLKVF